MAQDPGVARGAFLIGLTVLVLFADWITGDLFDVGWWGRPLLVVILGFLLSVPYGWAWMHGKAPLPPAGGPGAPSGRPGRENGNTYVLVGPTAPSPARAWRRRSRRLGPVAWFFYTVFWRWPLVIGDAVLTVIWRGIIRVAGVNGGPRLAGPQRPPAGEVDYPEDLSPPDRERF